MHHYHHYLWHGRFVTPDAVCTADGTLTTTRPLPEDRLRSAAAATLAAHASALAGARVTRFAYTAMPCG